MNVTERYDNIKKFVPDADNYTRTVKRDKTKLSRLLCVVFGDNNITIKDNLVRLYNRWEGYIKRIIGKELFNEILSGEINTIEGKTLHYVLHANPNNYFRVIGVMNDDSEEAIVE